MNEAYKHFDPNRRADDRISNIPDCARRILEAGHTEYLPLHFFAEEVREEELRSRLIIRASTAELPPIRVKIAEADATHGLFSAWSGKHLLAMELLKIPAHIHDMFERHYKIVSTAVDFISAWPVWREYDMAVRAKVVGLNSPGIGFFDSTLFASISVIAANRTRMKLEAALAARAPIPPAVSQKQNAGSSTAVSKTTRDSKSNDRCPFKKLGYDCCFLCGSRAHQVGKNGEKGKGCQPAWLVHSAEGSMWLTPDTNALCCWSFNSPNGCKHDDCRRKGKGHRCSICGSSAHGCSTGSH